MLFGFPKRLRLWVSKDRWGRIRDTEEKVCRISRNLKVWWSGCYKC